MSSNACSGVSVIAVRTRQVSGVEAWTVFAGPSVLGQIVEAATVKIDPHGCRIGEITLVGDRGVTPDPHRLIGVDRLPPDTGNTSRPLAEGPHGRG